MLDTMNSYQCGGLLDEDTHYIYPRMRPITVNRIVFRGANCSTCMIV